MTELTFHLKKGWAMRLCAFLLAVCTVLSIANIPMFSGTLWGRETLYAAEDPGLVVTQPVTSTSVKSYTYTSSNKNVATVSKTGKITAKSSGKATINTKITLKNGATKTIKTKITVKE